MYSSGHPIPQRVSQLEMDRQNGIKEMECHQDPMSFIQVPMDLPLKTEDGTLHTYFVASFISCMSIALKQKYSGILRNKRSKKKSNYNYSDI